MDSDVPVLGSPEIYGEWSPVGSNFRLFIDGFADVPEAVRTRFGDWIAAANQRTDASDQIRPTAIQLEIDGEKADSIKLEFGC